jgi:predicted nucleotidyltransferase
MHSEHRQSLLERATRVLAGEPQVQIAIAFGSAVDGRAGFESDFDVAVLRDPSLDTRRRCALIEQLGQATGRPIDLVDLESAGIPIRQSILSHGQRLVCRDTARLAQLMSRTVIDAEDFLPYRRRLLRERRKAWLR